jgi:peptidoglycan/LPS O-acetylase OafA/YrhL
MPSLDGLRAFAIVAVLLYHADVGWLPGGFLGVDIFFVLSGYLITTLLLAEWQTHATIDLPQFWLRRARRLLPALLVVTAATLTFALLVLPDEVARLRGDALAALAYGTNWYLIFEQQSYFEAIGRPSLLQHLWSLAVEEQFYLLWPPLLLLLLRWIGQRGALLVTLALVATSAALMGLLYQPEADPLRLYYGTDTRAFAPLLGAALACAWPYRAKIVSAGRRAELLVDALVLGTLGSLVAACALVNEYQPALYQGGFVAVALITVLLLAALTHPAASFSKRVLGSAPLRWLGTRSYAIYLWHWPVFTVTRPELDVDLTGVPLLALRLGVTLLLAELSYRFVEMPFRSGMVERAWQRLRAAHGLRLWRLGVQWATATSVAVAFAVSLGVAVAEAHPPAEAPEEQIDAVLDAPVRSDAADASASLPSASVPTASRQQSRSPAPRTPAALTETDETQLEQAHFRRAASHAPVQQTNDPSTPQNVDTPAPVIRISAVGDSVMVGSAKQLRAVLETITIDAKVSRQAKAVIAVLRAQRDAGQLGEVVIVHTGTNGPFSTRQFDELMGVLDGVQRVVFVNLTVPRPWEDPNNAVIADGVARYPNAVLADWHAATADHPELFRRDGVHPKADGQRLYAAVIAEAVNAP